MIQVILRLSILLLLSSSFLEIEAQNQKGELLKGEMVSSNINPTEVHQYQINVEKDQFVFFKLMQQGVDMKITTYNVAGERIEDFDSPNGKFGPELFTLISSKKGSYRIDVSPFDEKEPSGKYELIVEIIRPKATFPNEQVDEIFAPWDNANSPGASVAVVKDGEIVFSKGYGLANLEYDIPNTPTSIFHIASVSKQFTVFSILLLEKEGKLNLEDDIRKYISEVPDFGEAITLRHLASHTSGLRDQWNLLSMAGWRMDDVITKEHILKLVSKQKELNFKPGEEFSYCNTGFTLLAEVVARVSEMSFAEFTQENIFEPLSMNNTLFYDDHEKIVKNRAYSYYSDKDGFKKSVLNYANVGATSLFTTVEDLSLWAMNFSNTVVGDANIIRIMNTPSVLNNGESLSGALGQFVGTYKGLKEIQHGGADAGYRSYLTRFPDENLSVAVFSNAAEFNSGGIAHKVVDIYLKDKLVTETSEEATNEPQENEGIVVSKETMSTYEGKFELQPGFIITISEKNGDLTAVATGQTEVALVPISVTEFELLGVDAKIEFVPNQGDNIELLKLHQGGQIMDAPRLQAFDTEGVILTDFTGEFYSEELSTSYIFEMVEDVLMARHNRLSDFEIHPVKKDVFTGDAWYFGQIEFIRDSDAEIVGFKVSNGRVKNLYFEKGNK